MTDFNVNTRKTRLKQALAALTQRARSALQRIEFLKKKDGWRALLKPGRLQLPRRSRAGFTLGETLLVVIIVISVLVGVVALYNGVVKSVRTAALRTQIIRAVAIIEQNHVYSGVYASGSLLAFLDNEGFTGKELTKTGAGSSVTYTFTSPFNTDITIVGAGSSAPRHFTVLLVELPPGACKAAALTFRDRGAGLTGLKIGVGNSPATVPHRPMVESAVATACAADENTVSLTF